MKTKIYFFFLSVLFVSVRSQTTNISGIINSYASVTGIGCQSANVNTTAGFNSGDKVILIQMKGAVIDSTNTTQFGTILNYKNAGNYELATIASVAGNTINFVDSILKSYTVSSVVQLVKVPVYTNVTVTGALTCQAWNGSTGGILALVASGNVSLQANIDVSGKGFLGGALSNGNLVSCSGDTGDYVSSSSSQGSARKGEGIVMPNLTRANGKGSYANGGGGGTDCNGGGAGGGNYGRGGHGGDSKCNVSCPPYFYQNSGGYSGDNLTYSNLINKIFLGGGGGAGHQNNSVGTAGTTGGGIVLIKADSIFGNNNFIKSDGVNNTIVAGNDGQGGGGAGGTVLLCVTKDSSLNVSVKGGSGGVDNFNGTDCHGKGGGGGGGIVWTFKPVSNMTLFLNGGNPGIFSYSSSYCYNTGNGATAGQLGLHLIDLVIPEGTTPCATNSINSHGTKENSIKFYPNPFSDIITVQVPSELLNSKYTVTDQLGRIILSGKLLSETNHFDLSELNSGMYFLNIGGQKSHSKKIIKN